MLVDVTIVNKDPMLNMILLSIGGGCKESRIAKGLYLCHHWNFDSLVKETLKEPSFYKRDNAVLEAYKKSEGRDKDFRQFLIKYEESKPERVFYKDGWKGYLNRKEDWDEGFLNDFGVVDSPEQLLSFYDFEADPRKFVISFVEIRREDQPSWGGWRYHKWGVYYGTQKPENEYLHDDKHIEKVYTYHVYEVVS